MSPEHSSSTYQVRRWRVSGRVQGVSFRASTARQAQALGIRGYAHNLPDGRVEVLACGHPEALDRLLEWLHRGPLLARVEAVQVEEIRLGEDGVPGGFSAG
ncbi:MAG: acylphosphatase [Pseudomonadota bacterium]